MLNSDIRWPSAMERLPATPATPSASPQGVSGLYRELNAEVMNFIQNGSQGDGRPSVAVSAETSAAVPDDASALALGPQGQWSQALVQRGATAAEPGVSSAQQQAFVKQAAPWADEVSQRLGVAPDLLLAHAALESGWGQRPIRQAGGADSYNLFGLKAGASWRGEVAATTTTEYVQGHAQTQRELFRAYPDQATAFRDFAQMLLDNPRYHGALQAGHNAQAYAQGLQRGGYATDPAYADKLQRVAARIQAAR